MHLSKMGSHCLIVSKCFKILLVPAHREGPWHSLLAALGSETLGTRVPLVISGLSPRPQFCVVEVVAASGAVCSMLATV